MLALSRRPGTALEAKNCLILELPCGQRIRVWLVDAGRGKVRCVIDADKSVNIKRGELSPTEATGPAPPTASAE